MSFADDVKNTLFHEISIMAQTPEQFSLYPGKDFTRNPKENDSYFLIRAKDKNMERLTGQKISQLPENFDSHVERFLTRSSSKKKRLHPESPEKYCCICKQVRFDYLKEDAYDEYHMTLRVLKLKITEDSYNFHSKKREFIEQEIWARLILYNFCSIITNHVTIKNRKRKYSYQVNYTVAFNACHYFIRLRNNEVWDMSFLTYPAYFYLLSNQANRCQHHLL